MKKPTLIFHIGNYNVPLQIVIRNSVANWELVRPTPIRQKQSSAFLVTYLG